MKKRVAAGRPLLPVLAELNQTMDKKAVIAFDKDNVSEDEVAVCPLDGENISRPDDRKHARAPPSENNVAGAAQKLNRKTAFGIVVCWRDFRHHLDYEDFLWLLQVGMVMEIFPQARAMVSNTRS